MMDREGEKMKNSIISIGIIGTGAMGSQHARFIHGQLKGARLYALSDVDAARLSRTGSQTGKPVLYTDPYELIADPEVSAVIVASPDSTHADYVLAALEQEKPVFCEKPLAASIEDVEKIIRKELEIGRKLISVGFNRRFDPRHRSVKKTCSSGELGQPILWKGTHRNAAAMYDTSGAFILNNSAGHDVDSARWLLGSDVREVYVSGVRSRASLPDAARDMLVLTMRMENNSCAVAEIYVNAAYGYEVDVEIVCQEGVVSSLPVENNIVRARQTRGTTVSDDFRAYFSDSYKEEIQCWTESLASGGPFPGADAWDGYNALVTTQAAGRSLESSRPVRLEMMEKPLLYM